MNFPPKLKNEKEFSSSPFVYTFNKIKKTIIINIYSYFKFH